MPNYNLVRFHFNGAVRLGTGSNDQSSSTGRLHSDTLASALYMMILELYSNEIATQFMNKVKLSGAFPYIVNNSNNFEYFIPKPFFSGKFPFTFVLNEDDVKKNKKVQWWPISAISDYNQGLSKKGDLAGYEINTSLPEFIIPKGLIPKNSADNEHSKAVKTEEVRTRIQHDMVEDTVPYTVLADRYADKSGLYMMYEFTDNKPINGLDQKTIITAALRLLADTGIGNDRTVGYGLFSPAFDSLHIYTANISQKSIVLGNYNPLVDDNDELTHLLQGASYGLAWRGGWYTGLADKLSLKQKALFFTEGSTFSNFKPGRIIDLTTPQIGHPVYRHGNPIAITI
ncbi:MAG: type III-A CRISPR-associated RAMP protein Csm4 [Bacteroidota bacterium]|nr:type III-A CRISPR-associated RAMP protein Csm4 [Bacteroidota bacterium]